MCTFWLWECYKSLLVIGSDRSIVREKKPGRKIIRIKIMHYQQQKRAAIEIFEKKRKSALAHKHTIKHIRVLAVTQRWIDLYSWRNAVPNGWKINLRKRKMFTERKRKRTTIANAGRAMRGRTIDSEREGKKSTVHKSVGIDWETEFVHVVALGVN